MKTRIQMNTSFTSIIASLAIISLLSLTSAANSGNKLGSAITFIPNVKDFTKFS
jgi:hypothetical protein